MTTQQLEARLATLEEEMVAVKRLLMTKEERPQTALARAELAQGCLSGVRRPKDWGGGNRGAT
jgi:hypothetical protein